MAIGVWRREFRHHAPTISNLDLAATFDLLEKVREALARVTYACSAHGQECATSSTFTQEYPGYGFAKHKGHGVPEHHSGLVEISAPPTRWKLPQSS